MTARLDPRVFRLPVADIRRGFYSDAYFTRTRRILLRDGRHPRVLMQVFTRGDGIVCGTDEAIAVLKLCADKPRALRIRALRDGAAMRARERLLLAARCGDPVPVSELAAILDRDAAGSLAAAGLVSLHSGTIRVTRKGRHVANEVCVRLFRDTRLRG